ncbi:MAG TPA: metallophosphoesterase [Methanotrichaceae archaeon]|nr:metallophosphoesterase [Methanotrichaceae archaeon]
MAIIAASDIHLGYMDKDDKHSLSDKDSFMDFLDRVVDKSDITDFFIVGDFLDMWRRDAVGVTIENRDVLDRLQELAMNMNVHFMAGNHDYRICNLTMYPYPFGISECTDPKSGFTISLGHPVTQYHFKHGYDFEPSMLVCEPFFNLLCRTNDEVGGFESKLYDIFSGMINRSGGRDIGAGAILAHLESINLGLLVGSDIIVKYIAPFLSRFKLSAIQDRALPDKAFLNSGPEKRMSKSGNAFRLEKPASRDGQRTVLVFGHTHTPFHYIDKENRNDIINLGSWVTTYKDHNTYLEIREGVEILKKYPYGFIKPVYELPGEFSWIA